MEIERAELLTAGAVGLVATSLLLPWVTADGPVILVDGTLKDTQTGLESGDGILAIGAAVVAGIVAWVRDWDLLTSAVVGLVGLFLAGISALYISDPAFGSEPRGSATASDIGQLVEPGVGLVFSLAGGVLLLLATYSGYGRSPEPDTAGPRADRRRVPETESRPGQERRRAPGPSRDRERSGEQRGHRVERNDHGPEGSDR